jgi:hypothetical protein
MEEVRAEDGQGQPLPTRLLPLHHGHRLPGAQAGNYSNKLASHHDCFSSWSMVYYARASTVSQRVGRVYDCIGLTFFFFIRERDD